MTLPPSMEITELSFVLKRSTVQWCSPAGVSIFWECKLKILKCRTCLKLSDNNFNNDKRNMVRKHTEEETVFLWFINRETVHPKKRGLELDIREGNTV